MFWRRADYVRILSAYVRRVDDPGFGRIISLGGLACERAIFEAADGEQHLLLRTASEAVEIHCVGERISIDPFAFELVMDDFPDVESRQRLVARLAHIFRGGRKNPMNWSTQQLWHRDALIAFDGWLVGLSHRQIAQAIYGAARVERDWRLPDRTLKNRIARAIKRGRALVNGGYRKLLR